MHCLLRANRSKLEQIVRSYGYSTSEVQYMTIQELRDIIFQDEDRVEPDRYNWNADDL